jgi:transposase
MYIGYGTGFKSEQEAFNKAVKMAEAVGMDSIRLDRYYALQKYVRVFEKLFGKDIMIYLIPKKNATIRGPWKWKKILEDFVNDTKGYLVEYFRRNQSESGFSEDKRRFGWKIPQKKPERIDANNFCTSLWHNMLWLGTD